MATVVCPFCKGPLWQPPLDLLELHCLSCRARLQMFAEDTPQWFKDALQEAVLDGALDLDTYEEILFGPEIEEGGAK